MKRNIKVALMSLSAGALVLGLGGCEWFWRMMGDAVGDTLVYNVLLD
ncbi:MAG: hypothetical protein JXO22_18235 [Phycisphaerae bacterium]|nr:hypothetical protein [Phycisphaerae bacterium]